MGAIGLFSRRNGLHLSHSTIGITGWMPKVRAEEVTIGMINELHLKVGK